MAVCQTKERKLGPDENGRSMVIGPFFLSLVSCIVMMIMIAWSSEMGVNAQTVSTNVTMVVNKDGLSGPCVDDSGNEVGDSAEWSTGCNRIVCHVEPSGNYTVTHGCRDLVPSENPDDINCVTLVNSNAAYPDCCPVLDCGSSSGLSTVSPSACADISSNSSCQFWKESSNNCTNSTAFTYQFTFYCNATCGRCSPGVG